jgi:2,5-diketo-D-gluconate reductase B
MNRSWTFLFFIIGAIMNISAFSSAVEVDIKNGMCRIEGIDYPMVGYGTYLHCKEGVEAAAKIGYRILDTATYYYNFKDIAQALKNFDRRQFYIISKVWRDKQWPHDLQEDLNVALQQLQIDYLDCYFLHLPNSETPIEKTLAAMQELVQAKKIRHIGLSNVSVNHVKRALEIGVPIQWVQVEMHPHFYDLQLIQFCKQHGIVVQAWAPLGRGRIAHDPVLAKMGEKYGKTAAQVAIRWIVQHGCIPLPGSKDEKHMCDNIDIWDFSLSDEEMEEINRGAKAGKRERFTKEVYGFEDEFDFSYDECWPLR